VKGGSAALLLRAVMRSGMIHDLLARLAAYAIAMVLLATAFGFVVATVYLALAEVVEAPLAALLTSLVLGGAAGVVLLSVRHRRSRKPPAGTAGADALLLSIGEQVRRDPWLSLALAAVLGALAGVSHWDRTDRRTELPGRQGCLGPLPELRYGAQQRGAAQPAHADRSAAPIRGGRAAGGRQPRGAAHCRLNIRR
jgi:hypothetical protein